MIAAPTKGPGTPVEGVPGPVSYPAAGSGPAGTTSKEKDMKTIRMILATAALVAGLGAAGQVAHAADTHPAVKPALTDAPTATFGLWRTPRGW